MSARSYFAWDMLSAAAYQDERRDQGDYKQKVRDAIGHPLKNLSENIFIKDYRLNKEAFEDLCLLLGHYTNLKSSQRVSLETKICDHRCMILSVNAKFGGATHDSFIWENSNVNNYIQSLHEQNEVVWLLGDSGYPQRPWLMTPYLNPAPNSVEEHYNNVHTSTRVVIENTFGRLKNRWRCVHRDRTLHYKPKKCAQIIIACCVLHNIAMKYNVPQPEETEIDPGQPEGADSVESTDKENVPASSSHSVVGGAHAFILRISRFLGLAPLRFQKYSTGFLVSISNPMCIYSYILVTILVITTILGHVSEIYVGVKLSVRMTSPMSQVVSTCDVMIVVATASAGVYGAPRRMRKMLKFMDSVAMVDNSIGGRYSVARERKLCAILLSILVFFTVLIVDDVCFYAIQAKKVDRQWSVVINYSTYYILWYVVMILELQFAFTALSIRARFQAVNDALALTAKNVAVPLEKTRGPTDLNIYAIRVAPADSRANVSLLMESVPEKDTVIIKKSVNGESRLLVPPSDAIHRLSALHGSLCEVVHCIDENYGVPLVVVLISTLLHLIVTPYFLIMEIIVSSHRIHFLVLQFLWCVTHMIRLIVVVEPCHYTISEGRRTESLVCRLMMASPIANTPLPSRLELFSRQLMLQTTSYSPMGMCTLDRPLIASILGAVTTYLVILIQFQRYEAI